MKTKRNEHMWGEGMELQTGMPVVLKNEKGLGKYPLWYGQDGMVNSIVNVDNVEYIYFMPDNGTRIYVIEANRVVINAEKIEAWLEANA